MQSLSTPTPDDLRWASPVLLGITIRQLREWSAQAQLRITLPKAEEDAWEGTEIDVRRTVL